MANISRINELFKKNAVSLSNSYLVAEFPYFRVVMKSVRLPLFL